MALLVADRVESFNTDIVVAANQPMVCGRSPSEYRAYSPRAVAGRWQQWRLRLASRPLRPDRKSVV